MIGRPAHQPWMAFDARWFQRWQWLLLAILAEPLLGRWFRWVLCIRKQDIGYRARIVALYPHAYVIAREEASPPRRIHYAGFRPIRVPSPVKTVYTADFRTHPKFAKRIYFAFRPLWWLCHGWDSVVANPFRPAWNLGFDTLTTYPDPGDPGTTTCDGYAYYNGLEDTFANVRNAVTSLAAFNTATNDTPARLAATTTTNKFGSLARGMYGFNTSAVLGGTVSTGVFSLYGTSSRTALGDTTVELAKATPASNTTIVGNDYTTVGRTAFSSAPPSLSTWSIVGYNDYTLNASGIANVSPTGVTWFSLQLGWDLNNSFTGTWSSGNDSYVGAYFADQTGTTNDPKLVITYTPGAKIRQEINIIDGIYTDTNADTLSNEIVQLDTTQYGSASVTYYFEIVAKNATAGNATVALRRNGTTTEDASITTVAGATYALYRSGAFTPPAGATAYIIRLAPNGASTSVKSARIIVIQQGMTSTETQIEIGNQQSFTASTLTALTNPKYWRYASEHWNGTITAYWETVMTANSTKVTATAELQVDDGAFGTWTAVGSDLTTTSATPTRVRSAAITLTAGRHYRVVYKTSNSKSAINVYCAKIIIDQSASPTKLEPQYLLLNTGDIGTGAQSYLTKWDATEWTGTTVRFKYAHDATNAADSSKLIDASAAGASVTGAIVTRLNHQQSVLFTMPTGPNLDVNVVTSTGVVCSGRILALVNTAPKILYFHTETTLNGATAPPAGSLTISETVPDVSEASGAPIAGGHLSTSSGVATSLLNKPTTKDETGVAGEVPTTNPPNASHRYAWFSDAKISGTFAAGDWRFQWREDDDTAGIVGHPVINLYACATRDFGASIRFVAQLHGSTDWWAGPVNVTHWYATGVSSFTLTNEFLIVQMWCHETSGLAGGKTLTLHQEGSNLTDDVRTFLETTGFTAAATVTPIAGAESLRAGLADAARYAARMFGSESVRATLGDVGAMAVRIVTQESLAARLADAVFARVSVASAESLRVVVSEVARALARAVATESLGPQMAERGLVAAALAASETWRAGLADAPAVRAAAAVSDAAAAGLADVSGRLRVAVTPGESARLGLAESTATRAASTASDPARVAALDQVGRIVAVLVSTDTDRVAMVESTATRARIAAAESSRLGVSDLVGRILVALGPSESLRVGSGEATAIRARAAATDQFRAGLTDLVARLAALVSGADALRVDTTEAAATRVAAAAAESVRAGLADAVGQLAIAVAVAESLRATLAEAVALQARLSVGETSAVGLSERSLLRAGLAATEAVRAGVVESTVPRAALSGAENLSLGLADAVARLLAAVVAADVSGISLADTSAILGRLAVADAARLGLSDLGFLRVSLAVLDALAGGVSERAAARVAIAVTDQGAVRVTDTTSAVRAAVVVAEALGITPAEAVALLVRVSASDTPTVVLGEVGYLVVTGAGIVAVSAAETLRVALLDGATIRATLASSDAVVLAMAEKPSLRTRVAAAEVVAVSAREGSLLRAALAVADGLRTGLADTLRLVALLRASDALSLAASERVALAVRVSAAEAQAIGLGEVVRLLGHVSAAESVVVVAADAAPGILARLAVSEAVAVGDAEHALYVVRIKAAAEALGLSVTELVAQMAGVAAADGVAIILASEGSARTVTQETVPPSGTPGGTNWRTDTAYRKGPSVTIVRRWPRGY